MISPHTDDETIGPGGTLLKARQAGADLSVLYLSTNPPTEVTRTEVAEAAKLGGYAVDFLDLPIGNMPLDAAGDLAHKIAEGRPDHLFVPFILDDHDDHRRANELLLRAHATLPLSGRVNIWAYQVYGVVPMNVMIDVTDVADRKADLIRCYKTQAQRRDWAHYALGMNAFNSRFLHAPGARYAEAFFMVPSPEYLALCSRFLSRPELIYRDHYTQRP